MVEVGFAGRGWHNGVHLVNANHVKVADGTAFWRKNENLLILHINSGNWSCSGVS